MDCSIFSWWDSSWDVLTSTVTVESIFRSPTRKTHLTKKLPKSYSPTAVFSSTMWQKPCVAHISVMFISIGVSTQTDVIGEAPTRRQNFTIIVSTPLSCSSEVTTSGTSEFLAQFSHFPKFSQLKFVPSSCPTVNQLASFRFFFLYKISYFYFLLSL